MHRPLLTASLLTSAMALAACASSPAPRPAPAPQPYPGYAPSASQPPYGPQPAQAYPPSYAPQPYPPSYAPPPPQSSYPPAPQPQPSYVPQPLPSAPAQAAPAQASRPLLGPLIGAAAWQAEVRAVLAELISNLSASNQARVRGIPLVFDPNPFEVNAFAGCGDDGAPYLAGTEGLLEAIDAIAQTHATDEMFGTQTYEQYAAAVIPRLAQSSKSSAALPAGIIPTNVLFNVPRISHAHEWFDDVVAFTFGHELGHHYLGHTGCANGQQMGSGPTLSRLGVIVTNAVPLFNQPLEVAADSAGAVSTLDTGLARSHQNPPLYRWTERGGLALLDFFARLERAMGLTPLNPIGFLQSHPNSAFRAPIVQAVARTWYLQHPG